MVCHDSCYLGRYNDIYDPQRDVLDAMPDVERVETKRNKQIGLCCGAGGEQMWMEIDIGERMNMVQTDELLNTEPKVIAVACNFCMTMVDDGVKARGREDVEVMDLAQPLLSASLTPKPRPLLQNLLPIHNLQERTQTRHLSPRMVPTPERGGRLKSDPVDQAFGDFLPGHRAAHTLASLSGDRRGARLA